MNCRTERTAYNINNNIPSLCSLRSLRQKKQEGCYSTAIFRFNRAERVEHVKFSLVCFRCWELWSLGGMEDFYIPPKLSPNLPAAKANKRSHKEVTGLEFFMIFLDSYNCACPLAPIGAMGYNSAVPSQRERRSLTYRRAPSRRAGRHIGRVTRPA